MPLKHLVGKVNELAGAERLMMEAYLRDIHVAESMTKVNGCPWHLSKARHAERLL